MSEPSKPAEIDLFIAADFLEEHGFSAASDYLKRKVAEDAKREAEKAEAIRFMRGRIDRLLREGHVLHDHFLNALRYGILSETPRKPPHTKGA